ncbi:signal recognition particle receptor FtsY [Kordiimonas sediminis]|uniref:Signal recognition particle receptor FtsY n=1 Tax=Kordiimonas sediminis TaxID=1735581 RepID=A0A919AQW8_9PROT|nr:signal recognition particle-docking protein FtsY [Kordiimonas sediminis]GHF19735.1 signal recognition particle receptor FtsY [Kordiimonas sediminis]
MSDKNKISWFDRLRGKKAADVSEIPSEDPLNASDDNLPAEDAAPPAPPRESTPEPEPKIAEAIAETVEPAADTEAEETAAPDSHPDTPEPDLDTPLTEEDSPKDTVEEPAAKESWFQRLKKGLKKSTSAISDGITGIFTTAKLDDDTLEELEDLLITSDLGVGVASKLTAALSQGRYNKEISGEEVKAVLAEEIEAILKPVAKPLVIDPANKPHVILMAGVNGAGKTTTIGKLAKKFRDEGKSVMLAAGDTFRAAAVEQLTVWGERVGVPVITKEIGSDAAALAYEAMERAINDGTDVLLIDTAGRLQNRDELMAELAKVVRVINKKLDGAPHDTVIVLDATTGQNAVHQVEVFSRIANISGIVMTKLDGSARGGVLVACAEKFGMPVHAIGVGEAIEDLQPFDARDFAKALVGIE